MRAGRAGAPAEHVGADDEVALGVERVARAEERRPPLVGVGRAGERMADDDGVAAVGVELAPGAIGDPHLAETRAALEFELGDGEVSEIAR